MPTIYEAIDKSAIPASAHIVARHVKDNKLWTASTSYYTDEAGTVLDWEKSIDLLIEAKSKIGKVSPIETKNKSKIDSGVVKIRTMPTDPTKPGNFGFAVTWGEKTGVDGQDDCEWIVMWLTSKMAGGRYPWVTAYPATTKFMTRKGLV